MIDDRIKFILTCPKCKDKRMCQRCKSGRARPLILEIYELPRLIRYAECSYKKVDGKKTLVPCCALFACQRVGCDEQFFRIITHARQSSKQFCGPPCANKSLGEARRHRTIVPCAYCDKPVERINSQLRTFKIAYCNQACKSASQIKIKLDLKDEMREDRKQSFVCNSDKCRGDIQDHVKAKRGYECMACKARSVAPSCSIQPVKIKTSYPTQMEARVLS